MRSKRSPVLIAALLAFTGISAGLFALEFMAFERNHENSLGQKLATEPVVFAFSLQANQGALRQCDRQLSPPIALTKTAAELGVTAQNCARFARNSIELMPTNGLGYFVMALTEYQFGNQQPAFEYLQKSASLAPSEGWLAQRRMALAFRHQDFAKGAFSDIDILLTTQTGAEFLTGFYMHRPATRVAISARLITAGSGDQIRFINLLRKGQAKL